ncbi:MAG: Asp-tRNA(Asn)/Glu-tRNA(Gln) amidotransferase subunit GatC [Patescibacteria group bacterium]
MISKDDIKKLSSLSRITISEKEEEKLAKDMEGILSYVGQLSEVEISDRGVSKEKSELKNIMREDVISNNYNIVANDILKESPKLKGDYIVVKKIL